MKKINLLAVILYLLLSPASYVTAQPEVDWAKNYDFSSTDICYDVIQTSDGGFLYVGHSQVSAENDISIIRIDEHGDTLWCNFYGDDEDDRGYGVIELQAGGYVVTGQKEEEGDDNLILLFIDDDGDVVRTKKIGGEDQDRGDAILQTPEGDLVILGRTQSYGNGSNDIWLLKTDTNGDTIWTKTLGGEEYEYGNDFLLLDDGSIVVVGRTGSFGNGSGDVWLVKVDSEGDSIWANTFGGEYNDDGLSLVLTADSCFAITGKLRDSGNEYYQFGLIKADWNGDSLWARTYFRGTNDEAYSITNAPEDGLSIVGRSVTVDNGHDYWMLRTDANGDSMWSLIVGGEGSDFPFDHIMTENGEYLIAGYSSSFEGGGYDVWLVKTGTDPLFEPEHTVEETEWTVRIKATSGLLRDHANFAGGSPGGSDGFDADLDFPNPPPHGNDWIDVYFPREEWNNTLNDNFSSDIRAGDSWFNDYAMYPFEVASNLEDIDVDLRFITEGEFPEDASVILLDYETEYWQNLKINRFLTVSLDATPEQLVLLIGTGTMDFQQEVEAGWHMVCPPGHAEDMTPEGLFGDELEEGVPTYGYHRSRGYQRPEEMNLGYGYWLGAYNAADLQVFAMPHAKRFERQLNIGINLIGNPFPQPYPLDSLWFRYDGEWHDFDETVEDTIIIPELIGYRSSGEDQGYYDTNVFTSFNGYWFTVLEQNVRVRFNPDWSFMFEGDGEAPQRDEEGDGESWVASIRASFGDQRDIHTRFGYKSKASEYMDVLFDRPEPPNPPGEGWVSAYFVHNDWSELLGAKYNADIRSFDSDGTWDLTVETDGEGDVTLDWNFPEFVTCDFNLYDTEEDVRIDMEEGEIYTYQSDGNRVFQIEGRLLSITKEPASTTPTDFEITDIAPNPFNPETVISYSAPNADEITIEVFDLTGRLVSTLLDGSVNAGSHRIVWDGRNMAAGQYIVQLVYPDGRDVKKIILLK